ncbi:AraC family transcriptional regulator [Flammeovirgaceae bacterium 311]|nr:AraC family transcriptional regulator [Flammeovirgaceae bacterium 311]
MAVGRVGEHLIEVNMLYQEMLPHPGLKKFVLNYWLFRGPNLQQRQQPVKHTAPPDGCVSLIFLYNNTSGNKEALLIGPSSHVIESIVYPDSICVGVRAFPGMAEAVFGVDAKALLNNFASAQTVLGQTGTQGFLDSLALDFSDFSQLDECLLKHLPLKAEARDDEVQKAVDSIIYNGGRGRLSLIKQKAAISERQLQKRFLQKTGLSMKEFAGNCKMRATLIEAWVAQKDFFDTLYQQGYYDQAHFLHHLNKISKSKPAAFREHVQQILHQGVEPFDILIK